MPNSVEEFVLNSYFNFELNNLSSSKKVIIKNDIYDHELNCLPNNLEYLQLPMCYGYDKEIKKYPNQLKTIICHKYYKKFFFMTSLRIFLILNKKYIYNQIIYKLYFI